MTPDWISKLHELFTEPERELVSGPITDEMARLSNAYVLAVQREQAIAARTAIPRLLAEREALLAALKALEKHTSAGQWWGDFGAVVSAREKTRAAIVLAES